MKKQKTNLGNWKPFVSGMCAMALLVSLTGTAFAAAGKLEIGTGGIVVADQVKVKPGTEYAADGKQIPAVVTYEDASGETHNYVPVEMISDYLDIPTSWSEKRNSVVLGPTSEGAVYQIFTDTDPVNPIRDSIVKSPVLGARVGPFTEIDPKTVDMSEGPKGIMEDETKVETYTGFDTEDYINPQNGKHIVLTITNNGSSKVISRAGRAFMYVGYDALSRVEIEPGQTLTRAFAIDDDADRVYRDFVSSIISSDHIETMNVTVSLMQYE